jgi:hypothetical protein
MWDRRYSSTILELGNRRRWVVSLTSRPLYPWEEVPSTPLDRRLGGPQSRCGHGVQKNLAPARNRTPRPFEQQLVIIPTELLRPITTPEFFRRQIRTSARRARGEGVRETTIPGLLLSAVLSPPLRPCAVPASIFPYLRIEDQRKFVYEGALGGKVGRSYPWSRADPYRVQFALWLSLLENSRNNEVLHPLSNISVHLRPGNMCLKAWRHK